MPLSKPVASARYSAIKSNSITYNFHLILLQGNRFHGLAEISFVLENQPIEALPIDFNCRTLRSLIVNDSIIPGGDVINERGFITLGPELLGKGRNEVTVLYTADYQNSGEGCVTYTDLTDPAKPMQYLYTQFQPYAANLVFPCFDQPDLKAPMKLTVISPSKWKVLSNENPSSSSKFNSNDLSLSQFRHAASRNILQLYSSLIPFNIDLVKTSFKQTKILPTYLYCFVAGDYVEVKCQNNPFDFPMSIYAISSYRQYLENLSWFIFDVTINSMKFYTSFFGFPFAFPKYDQVWVHEFIAGAMENAGIVTFNDATTLFKETPTSVQYFNLANTITHELAHHWFGDLVTMKWWDDLWLNESFADFISHFCLENINKDLKYQFASCMSYYRDRKQWGYQQDERSSTTHPVSRNVPDTSILGTVFDGIAYSKGGSSLKQLLFLMGEEGFSQALSRYFHRYAWNNAEMDDFLKELSKNFNVEGYTLEQWKQEWLLTESVNVYNIEWTDSGTITVHQKFYDNNVTNQMKRHNKIQVAFFDENFKITSQVVVLPAEDTFAFQFDPQIKAKAILLNHGDYAFMENIIDAVSLAYFVQNINHIDDVFTRTVVWYNIYSMVQLAQFKTAQFLNMIADKVFEEKANFLLEKVLGRGRQVLSSALPIPQRTQPANRLFTKIVNLLASINPTADSERTQILINYLISFGVSEENRQILKDWYQGKSQDLSHLTLNMDQKWAIVESILQMSNVQADEKKKIFDAQYASDSSDRRILKQLTCDALMASRARFEEIYNDFKVFKEDTSTAVKDQIAIGWRNQYHYQWMQEFREKYFNDAISLLQSVPNSLPEGHYQSFYNNLKPIDDDIKDQIVKFERLADALADRPDLQGHLIKIKKLVDDLKRRQAIYGFNSEQGHRIEGDSDDSLTEIRAIERFKYVKQGSIIYNYHISFQKGDKYSGLGQLKFELTSLPPVELQIDFYSVRQSIVYVNSSKIQPIFRSQFLILPAGLLSVGINTVAVLYENNYNNDGFGCITYTDTNDGNRQYIYTTFEPRSAYKTFPCFDQPDLKAKATFNIIVPNGWIAAGNQLIQHQAAFTEQAYKANTATEHLQLLNQYLVGKSGNFYVFNQTKLISTYLYALVAGEYSRVDLPKERQHNGIPMALYCLHSYAPFLQNYKEFIFEITIKSMIYFQQKFAYPYPFTKYDQVFAHEYKMGAMQNPGLVTFKDTYLTSEEVPVESMLAFANTIVHECSHHWFGDLVTMKWWNDLWLNQSFADFISYYCLESIKGKITSIKYNSAFAAFVNRKVRGYKEDQMSTNHPVRAPVANTSIALSIFDGITYSKGASCLRQLLFLMSEDKFFAGIQQYFKAFEWKNGTINDLLNFLQKHFANDQLTLDHWKEMWLQTSSFNDFKVVWNPNDHSAKSTLDLIQSNVNEAQPLLRIHKINLALFKLDGTFDVIEDLMVNGEKQSITKIHYNGSKRYCAVLVNHNDNGFVKHNIDKVSLTWFLHNMYKIQDFLTRMIIWHHINQLVKDARLRYDEYVENVLKIIFLEPQNLIVSFVFEMLLLGGTFVPLLVRKSFHKIIFSEVLKQLKVLHLTESNKFRIMILKDQLIKFAYSQDDIDKLVKWKDNKEPDLLHHRISGQEGWSIIKKMYSSSKYTKAQKQLAFQDWKSKHPVGADSAKIICDTLIADKVQLNRVYGLFFSQQISVDMKKIYAQGYSHHSHLQWLVQNKKKFFSDIVKLSETISGQHFSFFYDFIRPIDDNLQENIKLYEGTVLPDGGQFDGDRIAIRKIIDEYKQRHRNYIYNVKK